MISGPRQFRIFEALVITLTVEELISRVEVRRQRARLLVQPFLKVHCGVCGRAGLEDEKFWRWLKLTKSVNCLEVCER